MSFLYPAFLWGLAALAIPVIIHLFSFRRFKTVYFSNVKFLKEVKEETSSRSKLKHILVLIARMLAIAFLVFAFAQPFIPKEETEVIRGSQAISVYIDNSFSMDAIGDQLSLLDKGKEKAREIVEAYGPEDQFNLVTNDFEGKHQRMVSREIFLNYLDDVEISPSVKNVEQVMERQLQAVQNQEHKNLFLISDFQENITSFEEDTTANVFVIPIQAGAIKNISIDSVWMEAPVQLMNQENTLLVKFSNHGDEEIEGGSMTLRINEETKALGDFSIEANSSITDTMKFTINSAGWHLAELSIVDYPITFDDNFYFSFFVPEKLDILSINGNEPSPYITALGSQEFVNLVNNPAGQVDYSTLQEHQVIILNQLQNIPTGLAGELREYLSGGGSVLIFPSADADLESYNRFLAGTGGGTYQPVIEKEQPVVSINMEEGLYSDAFDEVPENLFLPSVNKFYPISSSTRTREQVLLRMRDGGSFLSKFDADGGSLYLSAVPPVQEFSDFPRHTIFVVTLLQIPLKGNEVARLYYTIGRDNQIQLRHTQQASDQVYKMQFTGSEGVQEFIPEQRTLGNQAILQTGTELSTAGIYEVTKPGQERFAFVAFNYDRQESDLERADIASLKNIFSGENVAVIDNVDHDLTGSIVEFNEGIRLWKLCIIFALIFLAAEVLLLRFLTV